MEDDRDHLDLILRAFRDDPEPFRISVAGTIHQAQEITGRDPPDLVISDWNLPDGKGIDILARVDGKVTTPLIVMTGFGDERLAVEIMKSGAVDYVVKSATVFEDLPNISRKALRFWENIHERRRAEQAVQDSQKRLADILDFMPDPVLAVDTNGTVIAWNKAMEGLTGVPAADMLGKGDHEYSIPFYGERRPILIDLVLADNAAIQTKYDYVQRDGDRITLETFIAGLSGGRGAYLWGTAVPLYDTAGTRVGAIEVIRDITDRKRTEQAIQASEEKFRSLVEDVPNFIIVHRNGNLLFVNHAAAEATGLSTGDLLGRSMLEFVIPEDRAMVSSAMRRRMEGEALEPYEIRIQTRSGEILQVIVRGSRIVFDGAPASLNVMTDVTETRKGEEALKLSEVRFRDLFNNMSAGVIIYEATPDGTDFLIRDLNHAVETIEQVNKEEILNRGVLEVFPGVRDFGLFDVFLRVAKTGIAESHPVSMYRDNRISGWRENYVYRLPSGEIVAIYEDVTAKKQAEEERQRLLGTVQEEKEKLSVLLNSIADEVWFTDMNHRFTLANPRAVKEFNLDPDQCPGVEALAESLEILRPDGSPRPVEEAPALRALTGEIITGMEEIVRTPCTGELRYRQVSSAPVRDSRGAIMGSVSVVRDITEQKTVERALNDAATRRRILIDQSRDGIVTLDHTGKVFEANQRFADMLGYPVEEMKDLHVWDWDASIEPDQLQEMVRSVDAKGDHFETRHHRKDGSVLEVEISTNAADFAGEKLIFCVVRDITEKKAARRALEESETRFRALIQNSSDIIRILDPDGRIIYESPSSERILGYPPGHQIGRDPMEDIHPDDLESVKNDMREVFDKTNLGIPTEFRIRKADGAYIWVDSLASNLLDVPGINGIVVTTRPIQQRKEAEAALQESEERLRLALDGAGAAFWEWHLPSGKTVFSDRFYTMLGYSPGEFPATYEGWTALMHPDDRERVLLNLQQQIQKRQSQLEIEYRIRAKDGPWLWILGRGKIVESDNRGDPTRITGVNLDITNRRLMESEIRSLNAVLEQRVNDRTEALSKANEALEEENAQRLEAEAKLQSSLDEKTMLLKEIHHRVKNNLQIIASLLNLQSRYIKDESTLAAIRESQNRVKAMALVHEKLYRSEDLAHIDLNEYIKFLGTGLFQFYGAKGRGIRFRLDMHDVDVDINTAIPLGLIINELISNSLKYAFPDGREGEVSLTIKKEGNTLTVIFHDNGIGMPESLDWRNTHSLGLQLVNTLTDQMDGTIELDRTTGTQFTLVLHEKK